MPTNYMEKAVSRFGITAFEESWFIVAKNVRNNDEWINYWVY
jgi:hypothetical protein